MFAFKKKQQRKGGFKTIHKSKLRPHVQWTKLGADGRADGRIDLDASDADAGPSSEDESQDDDDRGARVGVPPALPAGSSSSSSAGSRVVGQPVLRREWPSFTHRGYKLIMDSLTGLTACHCPFHGPECVIHRNIRFEPIGYFASWMSVDLPDGPAWALAHRQERKARDSGQTMSYNSRKHWFDKARGEDPFHKTKKSDGNENNIFRSMR